MTIIRLNPDTLHKNPGFTQAAVVIGPAKIIFVGGQNGVNKEGKIVGTGIAEQSEQAFRNLIAALDAAGATLEDVVKMTIYLVQGQSLQDAYAAVLRVQQMKNPPTVSMCVVAGLANPGYLIEIDAVAAIQ